MLGKEREDGHAIMRPQSPERVAAAFRPVPAPGAFGCRQIWFLHCGGCCHATNLALPRRSKRQSLTRMLSARFPPSRSFDGGFLLSAVGRRLVDGRPVGGLVHRLPCRLARSVAAARPLA